MEWDAVAFLKQLRAGDFDGRLNEELQRLSPGQLQIVEHVLERDQRRASASEHHEPKTEV
jgi:hypothetical protein